MILTQAWIKKQLRRVNLRMLLGKQRIHLSLDELSFYVCAIFEHTGRQRTFRSIHTELLAHRATSVEYSTFMHHVKICSKLLPFLFFRVNQELGIHPSRLYNVVDTTLIPEKEEKYITSDDWKAQRVTTRVVEKKKIHICGSKGLIFINRKNQVTQAEFLSINTSDQNLLKEPLLYLRQLQTFLLADRGFNSAKVRKRLQDIGPGRFISPYLRKQKTQLSEKEQRFYRKRWAIETVFQILKAPYSKIKLNLKGKYSKVLKKAKFYSTLTLYNQAHA